ncbi:MAG: sulfatase-like hydrolase/transferase, partial [Dorea sp.]|nr:sulfatase-like hydrolase/transferase [Dorea sp.]
LESMETTYTDKESGGAFDQNVIPELTRLAQENEDFSGTDTAINGGYAMPGATWTIAAMFSQTSGIPLSISIEDNSMDTQDSFFASAITLGDILQQAGYSQSLLVGSDATFGGRRLYFTEHGDFDIIDYMYARDTQRIPEDYRVWWGYEDQKLFEFAKERVTELAADAQPFNLTMLTVDTHFEDGYPCQICRNTYGDDQYSNVMACSSRQVDRFIKWIQQQDFYENTTIVLVGDHPTMDSDFCEDIDGEYIRRVYTSYINPAAGVATDTKRNYTTFDYFPTTLASLGVEIEGERLGLGTNLFSSKQTLTERFGLDYQKRQIGRKSELMERLADLDENKRELLVREGEFADITVGDYDIVTGLIPIEVRNIANIPEGIESVQMAVWTAGDQSDMQWIQMGMQEDGSYISQINVPSFGYKSGEYRVHVYVVDRTGAQYLLGAVQAFVR